MEWIHNPEYWVLVAFVIFMAFVWRANVFTALGKTLDDRAHAIRNELDEARRLREEAQALLADYQRKQRDAESEAKSIIDTARREAEALAADTRKQLSEQIERRTRQSEDKIARAEQQAVSEVRAAAVDGALAAASRILGDKTQGQLGANLVENSIRDVAAKLN